MGEGIVLLHGFPILAHGTADRALARGILDIEHWVKLGSKGRDIAHTRQHFITITFGTSHKELSAGEGTDTPGASVPGQCTGTPGAPAMYPVRLALPSHTNIGNKCTYVGPAYEGIPYPIPPVSTADEQCIIEAFVEEINKLFVTELATELRHIRVIEANEDEFETGMRGKRFILVGSSHLARLAFALEDQEGTVVDLSVPGWRATADSVDVMLN
jgi:hypothetical protein